MGKALLQLRYLSCIAQVDGVVGNSSSGLAEVPSFKKRNHQYRDRQRGRLQAASVINCDPTRQSIEAALAKLYTTVFQDGLREVRNPYGNSGASEKVVNTIKSLEINGLAKKSLYDLPHIDLD